MENSKSRLTPHEIFNNKKLFSNKIHIDVLQVIEEISTSLAKFEIENDDDKKLFFILVNHWYHDLCKVIFHLRQIMIKIDRNDQTVRDLQNVITGLNKIVLFLQESLNLEAEKLIVQLEGMVVAVATQVETLTKIMQYDNLQENKQNILDCQLDLLVYSKALKLYIQLFFLSPMELESLIHEIIEKVKNNLIQIETGYEILVEDFCHYTRHCVQYLQNGVDYMRKMNNTEQFPNDMVNIFVKAEDLGKEFINDLLETLGDENPMKKMLDVIDNCQTNAFKICLQLRKAASEDLGKKDAEKIKHLVIYLFITGITGVRALNQCIEDVIMKK